MTWLSPRITVPTHVTLWRESLYSDGQQCHQYQQNKRKFIQWWSTMPPISTKRTINSHLMNKKRGKGDNEIWRWKSRSWLGFIGFQPSSSHLMYSLLPPKGFNCHFTETRSWDTLLFHIFLGNRKQCFSGHHN